MSRVLLFVQTGDGRPKCVGRSHGPLGYWARPAVGKDLREDPAGMVFVPGVGNYGGTEQMRMKKHRADRWWLVECENAEAGRDLIARWGGVQWRSQSSPPLPYVIHGEMSEGRILASGGRQ